MIIFSLAVCTWQHKKITCQNSSKRSKFRKKLHHCKSKFCLINLFCLVNYFIYQIYCVAVVTKFSEFSFLCEVDSLTSAMDDNGSTDEDVKESPCSPKMGGKKFKLNDGSSQDSFKEAGKCLV